MAEIDVNAYATTAANAAAATPTSVETQQPGGSGALRQVMISGDAVTRANMQTIKAASTASTATDMGAVVHLHPSSPATQADTAGTGTVSATDALGGTPGGTGVLIATAPTASSFVAMAIPGGSSQVDVQVLGTATGSYYFEYSMDSTTGSDGNWITGLFRQSGVVNTNLNYVFTVNGVFRGACAGYKYFRIRNIGGTTPSNAITIRTSNGSGTMFLNAGLPASSNVVGKVGIDQTTPGTTNAVQITAALPTGTNTIGKVTSGSSTTGGLTPFTLISAASTNATSVKTSAGTVYSIQVSNTGAAAAFVKLYNKASAPTVGTDTAVKTLIAPAGGGIVLSTADIGIAFGTGIALAITALATTADVTAVALSQVVVNIDYV
jgi:hypothetical protein